MLPRLLIILLIAAAVYVLLRATWTRVGPVVQQAQRDPRIRATAVGFGLLALRALLGRAMPSLGRWMSLLRFFR